MMHLRSMLSPMGSREWSLVAGRKSVPSASFLALVLWALLAAWPASAMGQSVPPPRVTAITPSPLDSSVNLDGLRSITIALSDDVSIPAGAISIYGNGAGVIDGFDAMFNAASGTLDIELPTRITFDIITVVLDYSILGSTGLELDGELGQGHAFSLPSGNGVRGGKAVFRYRILPGDLNGDGIVDSDDLSILLGAFGTSGVLGDLNGDGIVDSDDLSILLGAFGQFVPNGDAEPVVPVAITPAATQVLQDDISSVSVIYSGALDPDRISPDDLFIIDAAGQLRSADGVVLTASDTVEFSFGPVVPQCGTYTLNLSNAIAGQDGGIALRPPVPPAVTGLTPPPVPSIDPVSSPTVEQVVPISGLASNAATVRVVGPELVYITPVVDGMYAVNVELPTDKVHTIFVSGVSACGIIGPSASIQITRDTSPPMVMIDFPLNGQEVTTPTVTVTGRVSDEFSGLDGLTVSVNGIPASVGNGPGGQGTFVVMGLPLTLGLQSIDVLATDALGNARTESIMVSRIEIPPGSPTIEVLAGDGQSAQVRTDLPEAIEVLLKGPNRQPLAGKVVTFTVDRNNGTLRAQPNAGDDPGKVQLQVFTNSQGIARVYWTLGNTAGAAANRVRVNSTDMIGTIFFCADGIPAPADRILVGDHNNQRGETGGQLAQPLIAYVTDGDAGNPAAGVPVTFAVTRGDGLFANGEPEITILTGSNGRAHAPFILGDTPGLNRVQATFDGNPGLPATFNATGIARVEGQPTTVSGIVLDNGGRAIGGALATLTVVLDFPKGAQPVILGPVATGIDGRFVFDASHLPAGTLNTDIPAGPGKVLVSGVFATSVGGEPIDREWAFPYVGYDILIVENASNTMQDPVWLPELDPANEVEYDGTQDVALTVAGIDGLEFRVKAGSMILEDGTVPTPGNPETIRLNQVHFDEVPMALPDGNAVPFAWTLQPKNATFDPPIEITLPNMTGEAPGTIVQLLQWNNDTADFQTIGTGQVSADGAFVVSESGSGIRVAGWGAWAPPPPPSEDEGNCTGKDAVKAGLSIFGIFADIADVFFNVSVWVDLAKNCFSAGFSCAEAWDLIDLDNGLSNEDIALIGQCASNAKSCAFSVAEAFAGPAAGVLKLGEKTNSLAQALDGATQLLTSGNPCVGLAPPGELKQAIARLSSYLAKLSNYLAATNLLGQANALACTTLQGIVDGAQLANSDSDDESLIEELQALFDQLDADLLAYQSALAQVEAAQAEVEEGLQQAIEDAEFLSMALPQFPEIAACMVQIAGQITIADEFGGFILTVPAPPGGPLVRALYVCEDADPTLYGASDYFEPGQGLDVLNQPVAFQLTPIPTPLSIVASAPITVLEPGQQTQLAITGSMSDGIPADLTLRANGTTYTSTNPAIASVSDDGLVTAHAKGLAFIMTVNEGTTTSRRIDVVEEAISTTITGVVQFEDGTPAVGAEVTLLTIGGTATADSDGSFALTTIVSAATSNLAVTATLTQGEQQLLATVSGLTPVADGFTDAGVLTLRQLCDPEWAEGLFCPLGLNGPVYATVVWDDGTGEALYVGGTFTIAGCESAGNIARWDGSVWSLVTGSGGGDGGPGGDGGGGVVNALAVFDDGSGPALYVGGAFTLAEGVAVSNIARFDGSSWSALTGPGGMVVNGTVRALTVFNDGTGTALYAGGAFSTAGGVTVNRIARWDGAVWSSLAGPGGVGVSSTVFALAEYDDGTGSALYVGGQFNTAGGVTVNGIARWDGTSWSELAGPGGVGLVGSSLRALAVFDDGTGPALYAGGAFTSAGGVAVGNIARWDGSGWSALEGPGGEGMNGTVYALTEFDDGAGSALYAGGTFNFAAGVQVNRIGRWDGSAWSALEGPSGVGVSSTIFAFTEFNDGTGPALYTGGQFNAAGGETVNAIARWDGNGWSALANPGGTGLSGASVSALAVFDDGSGPALYAGGDFTTAGGVTVNHIARWNGIEWSALKTPGGVGVNSVVRALAVFDDGAGPGLYAGGQFTTAGGVTINRIARWDGSEWSALNGPAGGTVNSVVRALAVFDDGSGPALYAGGDFAFADFITVGRIARWDGNAWSALEGPDGVGVNSGPVYALTVFNDDSGPALYAGGQFTTAGGVTVNRIARWDGSEWAALEGAKDVGVSNTVYALTEYDDGVGPALYVGGGFNFAGGLTVNGIARWDGTSWSELASPDGVGLIGNALWALDVFDDGSGSALYAGGLFTTAGGVPVSNLARWDGSTWSALEGPSGVGVNNTVFALTEFNHGEGPALFVGGQFTNAGGVPSWLVGKWFRPDDCTNGDARGRALAEGRTHVPAPLRRSPDLRRMPGAVAKQLSSEIELDPSGLRGENAVPVGMDGSKLGGPPQAGGDGVPAVSPLFSVDSLRFVAGETPRRIIVEAMAVEAMDGNELTLVLERIEVEAGGALGDADGMRAEVRLDLKHGVPRAALVDGDGAVRWIPALPGTTSSRPVAMNARGMVVGVAEMSEASGGGSCGFVYCSERELLMAFGTPGGGDGAGVPKLWLGDELVLGTVRSGEDAGDGPGEASSETSPARLVLWSERDGLLDLSGVVRDRFGDWDVVLTGALGVLDDRAVLVEGLDSDGDRVLARLELRVFERAAGDVNADGVVDQADLEFVVGAIQRGDLAGDVNGDGVVNADDLSVVVRQFGQRGRVLVPTRETEAALP